MIGSKNVPAPGPGAGRILGLESGAHAGGSRGRTRVGRRRGSGSTSSIRTRSSTPALWTDEIVRDARAELRPQCQRVPNQQRAARRGQEPRRRRRCARPCADRLSPARRAHRCRSTAATSGSSRWARAPRSLRSRIARRAPTETSSLMTRVASRYYLEGMTQEAVSSLPSTIATQGRASSGSRPSDRHRRDHGQRAPRHRLQLEAALVSEFGLDQGRSGQRSEPMNQASEHRSPERPPGSSSVQLTRRGRRCAGHGQERRRRARLRRRA